jgi:hypothetical protein
LNQMIQMKWVIKRMREDSMSDDIDDDDDHPPMRQHHQMFRVMETVCPTWTQKAVFVGDE